MVLGLLLALALAVPALGAKPRSSVTIAAAPNPVTFGFSTAISGAVSGTHSSGATVTLEGKVAPYTGAFVKVASTKADAAGHYVFKTAPTLNTIYRVTAKASPAATSPDLLVKVRVRITLRVSTRTPASGQAVRFSGFVLPAYNGRRVAIQRRTHTGWRTIARAKLLAATPSAGIARSRYSKRVTIRRSGRYRVRFNPADGLRIANNSRAVRLTVH
jgi:hypothetical protein